MNVHFTDWSAVVLERVRWLMIDRLPFGELTIVEGPGGLGKTTMLIDIAARVSTGRTMPDGTPCDMADIVLFAEEDRASTLKARLIAAGADLSRVHHVAGVGEDRVTLSLPSHAKPLLAVVQEVGARLVVIDALFSHLDPGLKSNVTEDVRRVLAPLSEIAHITGAAVTATRHWGKGARDAGSRGLGSIDITNIARSVLAVARHPHDDTGPRIVAVAKSNLGNDVARVKSLSFRLESESIHEGDVTVDVGRIVWGDLMAISADDLSTTNAPTAEESSKIAACTDRLRELLAEGPRPAADVRAELKRDGFAHAMVFRAMKKAAVHSSRDGFPAKATWSLTPQLSRARDHENTDTTTTTDTTDEQQLSHLYQSTRVRERDTTGDTTGETSGPVARAGTRSLESGAPDEMLAGELGEVAP